MDGTLDCADEMGTVLGACAMRLMSEFGTDEAYVDGVRRWLADPKRYWIRHVGVFLLLSVTAMVVPLLVAEGYEYAVDAKANPG